MLACAVLSPEALARSQADLVLYVRDGGLAASGALPYRDFPFEYPPLAILPMVLPNLVRLGATPTLLEFQWSWALLNAALASIVAALIGWIAARPGSNKVFSAQYALWALPLGCLLPRRAALATIAVALLSVFIYPLGYGELTELQPQAIVTLALRNALLLALLAWALIRYRPTGPLRLPGRSRALAG